MKKDSPPNIERKLEDIFEAEREDDDGDEFGAIVDRCDQFLTIQEAEIDLDIEDDEIDLDAEAESRRPADDGDEHVVLCSPSAQNKQNGGMILRNYAASEMFGAGVDADPGVSTNNQGLAGTENNLPVAAVPDFMAGCEFLSAAPMQSITLASEPVESSRLVPPKPPDPKEILARRGMEKRMGKDAADRFFVGRESGEHRNVATPCKPSVGIKTSLLKGTIPTQRLTKTDVPRSIIRTEAAAERPVDFDARLFFKGIDGPGDLLQERYRKKGAIYDEVNFGAAPDPLLQSPASGMIGGQDFLKKERFACCGGLDHGGADDRWDA